MAEREDPEMLAYSLSEHVHDTEPDPNAYLWRFVEALLTLEPGLRHRVSDLLTTEIKEAIAQTDPDQASAAIRLIERAEERWRNDDR